MNYNIELKWQKIWEEKNVFASRDNSSKKKYYVLEMFPYPSGRIHVGHLRNYAIGDVIARYMRAKGYNVLYTMGWDAFGLPAEKAAIKNNTHPQDWTYSNIDIMRKQLKRVGLSYDWNKEITSCDPEYYKHEQKFFLQLLKKKIAYQKESLVNWDPVDNTVLANEQVINGCGWRSGALVEKKYLTQWFLKITDYADELLKDIDDLDWSSNVKTMQKNWIGKSEGIVFSLDVENLDRKIEIYSTKPEVIFGATFIGIAYNHPLLEAVKHNAEIQSFIDKCKVLNNVENIKIESISTGLYAIHPFSKKRLPIVIANFVLMNYGTGAVYGCPAHDQRDFELAKNSDDIDLIQVVSCDGNNFESQAYIYNDFEKMVNSDFLDGMSVAEARRKIIEKFQKIGGSKKTYYRLHDWGISRQRYWGCPIPVVNCKSCGVVGLEENDLPVILPKDIDFTKAGNPLDNHPTWKYTICPKCSGKAERETDTFDTFFESSWYFARFCDTKSSEMVDKKSCDYWLSVDLYIGGIEHAILHLLYARFFTKLMADLGYFSVREPFKHLLTQGMVLYATYKDKDGNFVYPSDVIEKDGELLHNKTGKKIFKGNIEKMSKSKLNIVDLEIMLEEYGADVMRMFLLSDSPVEKELEWSSSGLDGCKKFISKLVRLVDKLLLLKESNNIDEKLEIKINYTIYNVSSDIESYAFNKAIAKIRELFNATNDALQKDDVGIKSVKKATKTIISLLNPFTPHISEELWSKLGCESILCDTSWSGCDISKLESDTHIIAIQINGKLRGTKSFLSSISEEKIKQEVIKIPEIKKYLTSKIKRFIFIPKKLVNIVM